MYTQIHNQRLRVIINISSFCHILLPMFIQNLSRLSKSLIICKLCTRDHLRFFFNNFRIKWYKLSGNSTFSSKFFLVDQRTYVLNQSIEKMPISDFQIQFSMSKIILIFLNFFFKLKNINLWAYFFLLSFFENFNL